MLAAAAPRPVQDVSIDYDVCIYPTSKERWPAPERVVVGERAEGRRERAGLAQREVSERHWQVLPSQHFSGSGRWRAARRVAVFAPGRSHAPDRDPAHEQGDPLHGGAEHAAHQVVPADPRIQYVVIDESER